MDAAAMACLAHGTWPQLQERNVSMCAQDAAALTQLVNTVDSALLYATSAIQSQFRLKCCSHTFTVYRPL